MSFFKKISYLFFFPIILLSRENYQISVDQYYSPYMGSDALISFHQGLESAEKWLAPQQEYPPKGFKPSVYRAIDLILLWGPLNQIEEVIQHEVFGHGYRVRSLKQAEVNGYFFDFPWPYGRGGGGTSFSIGDKFTVGELQAVTIAGLEAEEILSRQLKMQFIKNHTIDPRIGSLYDKTRYSSFLYCFAPFQKIETIEDYFFTAHDIQSYIHLLDILYPSQGMKPHKLAKKLLLNFLDPMTFYQMGSFWYYIFTGKEMSVPMIKLGKDISYLPNVSVQLAPYGLEYYLENFFLYKESPLYVYFKGGQLYNKKYYGAGMQFDEIWVKGRFSLGARFDLWYQPNFLTNWKVEEALNLERSQKSFDLSIKRIPGASLSLVCNYRFKNSPSGFFTDVGFKTKGYLPGYPLQSSPTWRVGLKAEF